jgi:5-methylcytosine-specific restriction endonuclease McrA
MTCPHTNRAAVWTQHRTGDFALMSRKHLREQCLDCGHLFGLSLAHTLATAGTPELNLVAARAAEESERNEREREWQERVEQIERERRQQDERWWDQYSDYLQSPEWRARRSLVLERDNHLCQGCRKRPATQAHHLSYKHVGKEFLWELVAVCDECHNRFHGYDEVMPR